jgi:hypothetical protein
MAGAHRELVVACCLSTGASAPEKWHEEKFHRMGIFPSAAAVSFLITFV